MRRSRPTRRGRPTARSSRFVERSRRTTWICGSAICARARTTQVTRERAAVSGPGVVARRLADRVPRRSARNTDRPDQARRLPRRRHRPAPARRARTAHVGAGLPSVGCRRAVSVLGSVPRRAEPAAALRLRVGHVVPVGAFPAAFRRQPRERRPGLVAERHAHGVRHRGQALDGGCRRRGRRDRPAGR